MTAGVKLNMNNEYGNFGMVDFYESEVRKEQRSEERINEIYEINLSIQREFLNIEQQKADALRDISVAFTSLCNAIIEHLNNH